MERNRKPIGCAVLTLVFFLLLSVRPCMAQLLESRQTLPFLLDSVDYIEYAPLTPQTLPNTTHLQSQTLHFDGFDSSLGTLKDAYLSYEGTYGIEYFVKAGTRAPYWYESAVYGGDVAGLAYYKYEFGLTGPDVSGSIESIIDSGTMTTVASGSRFSGISYLNLDGSGPHDPNGDNTIDGEYLYQPWVNAGNLNTPLLSLSDGLNVLGGTVDVVLQKEITLYMVPFFSSFVDPDYSYVDNYLNKWSGTIALTYDYESNGPVPTPEPDTLLLVCAGLLGLAEMRRLKK